MIEQIQQIRNDILKLNDEELKIHSWAIFERFWNNSNITEKRMMIITEFAEIIEADRKNKRCKFTQEDLDEIVGNYADKTHQYDTRIPIKDAYVQIYKKYYKGTIEEEFADVLIRIIDLHEHMQQVWDDYQSEYNTREYESLIDSNNGDIPKIIYHTIENLYKTTIAESLLKVMDHTIELALFLNIDLIQQIRNKQKYYKLANLNNKKY